MKLVVQIPCLNEEATLPLVLESALMLGGFAIVLGVGAGLLASLWLVRTPPLELFGR